MHPLMRPAEIAACNEFDQAYRDALTELENDELDRRQDGT